MRHIRQRARVILLLAVVLETVLGSSSAYEVRAASPLPVSQFAPPDAKHTHPYTYQGRVFYMDDNNLTTTGATVEDTAIDPTFHPKPMGESFGPTKTIPNCVSAPRQGGPVDRAMYTDAQLAAYGLPTWAEWVGRGNTDRGEWTNIVRNSGMRLCGYHSRYMNGLPVIDGNLSGQATRSTSVPSKPMTARIPRLTFCSYMINMQAPAYWGWMSDSDGDCQESSYYAYPSMEGYLHVPNWNNGAAPNQDVARWLGRGGWDVPPACPISTAI